MTKPGTGDRLSLRLSSGDHALLLESTDLPQGLRVQLSAGLVEGKLRRFLLTEVEAHDLVASLERAIPRCGNRKLRRSLVRILGKVDDQFGIEVSPSAGNPFEIAKQVDEYNKAAQADMGGLSPAQAHALLYSPWDAASPGVQVRENVPLIAMEDSRIFHNARFFLASLNGEGTRCTARGNLNRAFIVKMLEGMRWREGYIEELHCFNKVINESDVWHLHELRVNLDLAGLIKEAKGRFNITRKGRRLIADDKAGELLALLFHTWFKEFNLAYRDRLPELREFQDTLAYPLYILFQSGENWEDFDQQVSRLLLPQIAERIPPDDYLDLRKLLVRFRLIEHLEDFGLVECRLKPSPSTLLRQFDSIRCTALYAQLLGFELPN